MPGFLNLVVLDLAAKHVANIDAARLIDQEAEPPRPLQQVKAELLHQNGPVVRHVRSRPSDIGPERYHHAFASGGPPLAPR